LTNSFVEKSTSMNDKRIMIRTCFKWNYYPVGKIAKKTVWRSVFFLSKILQTAFLAILPTGLDVKYTIAEHIPISKIRNYRRVNFQEFKNVIS